MMVIDKEHFGRACISLFALLLTSCSDGKNKQIEMLSDDTIKLSSKMEKLSKEMAKKAKDMKKLSVVGSAKASAKAAISAVAIGVASKFVYDAIKPQSINTDSRVLTTDYPFFATDKDNNRIPMEAGNYTIVGENSSYITINGDKNEIYLVKRGEQ